jgi:hypothetical protein
MRANVFFYYFSYTLVHARSYSFYMADKRKSYVLDEMGEEEVRKWLKAKEEEHEKKVKEEERAKKAEEEERAKSQLVPFVEALDLLQSLGIHSIMVFNVYMPKALCEALVQQGYIVGNGPYVDVMRVGTTCHKDKKEYVGYASIAAGELAH